MALIRIHESEPRILALIKLYDYIDISSSSSYLGLSPSDINIDNEKVNQIETSLSFYRLSSKKKEFNPSINKNDTKPKKKKRNPKLPTNYDPLILPNPERWLPKYERTGYKPKKKDKIKKGSHQGATNTVNKYFFSN
uniref:Signal recognition particle subunit SRP72 (Trinotate prediction) n=1 Tax=Henneguya salminicola TaxID=69463 RepID=A0A6G3MJQ8_HENSL